MSRWILLIFCACLASLEARRLSHENHGHHISNHEVHGQHLPRHLHSKQTKDSEEASDEDTEENSISNESNKEENEKVCQTEACHQTAQFILNSMDESVDPCQDFHKYTCGNWAKHYKIPAYMPKWTAWDLLSSTVDHQQKDLLSEEVKPDDILPLRLSKKWYQSCVNTDELERKGVRPLLNVLARIGGWPMTMEPDEWDEDSYSWQRVDKYYTLLTGSPTFAYMEIVPNMFMLMLGEKNISSVLAIEDLKLPFEELKDVMEYKRSNFYKEKDYKRLIEETAGALVKERGVDVSRDAIDKDIEDLFEFEKQVLKIFRPGEYYREFGFEDSSEEKKSKDSEDEDSDSDEDSEDSDNDSDEDSDNDSDNDSDEDSDDSDSDNKSEDSDNDSKDSDADSDNDSKDSDNDSDEDSEDSEDSDEDSDDNESKDESNNSLGNASSDSEDKSDNSVGNDSNDKDTDSGSDDSIPSESCDEISESENDSEDKSNNSVGNDSNDKDTDSGSDDSIPSESCDEISESKNDSEDESNGIDDDGDSDDSEDDLRKIRRNSKKNMKKRAKKFLRRRILSEYSDEEEDEAEKETEEEIVMKATYGNSLEALFKELDIDPSEINIIRQLYRTDLKEFYDLIKKTPKRTVVNYIHWKFISGMIQHTTEELRRLYFNIAARSMGRTEQMPRWLWCLDQVGTKEVISYEYVKNYFPSDAKAVASDIIKRIRAVIDNEIEKSPWMSKKLKEAAKEKVHAMKAEVGYPSWYDNATAIEHYYKGLVINRDYFDNMLNFRKYETRKKFQTLLSMRMFNSWQLITPLTVNAMYMPMSNSLTVTAVDFQRPFFDVSQPAAVNFGIIGYVIGHEISHGFDPQGRYFDKDGTQRNWPHKDEVNYMKRAQCFVKKYSAYTLTLEGLNKTIRVNGRKTIGDNVADCTGLQAVHEAYRIWREGRKDKEDLKLPGLEKFGNDQLFYLASAALWCDTATSEYRRFLMGKDNHSPMSVRILGAVSNTLHFADAFNCPKGSPMNPEEKCSIWK